MRSKKKFDMDLLRIIGCVLAILLMVANLCLANYTKKNPIKPVGGDTFETAISISDDAEIEVKIHYYTIYGVNKQATYTWDDGKKNNLFKNRFRVCDMLEVPEESGVHKLTIVYGKNEYVYYYNVEES